MRKTKLFLLSVVIEILGIMLIAVGIGLELAYKADIYWALISVGSLFVAGGGLLFSKALRRQ